MINNIKKLNYNFSFLNRKKLSYGCWIIASQYIIKVISKEESSIGIFAIAINNDFTKIVLGCADNLIRIIDVESPGVYYKIFKGHTNAIKSVVISFDSSIIVSGSWDNSVRVWKMESGICYSKLYGHTNYVSSVAISKDLNKILSGSADCTMRLWDLNSGVCLRVLEGHENVVSSVKINDDSSIIVSGSWDSNVRIWGNNSYNCIKVLIGHTKEVFSVFISKDSLKLVSGSSDRTVRLWDLSKYYCIRIFYGHIDKVYSVALSEDSSKIVSGSSVDSSKIVSGGSDKFSLPLRVYDVNTGMCLQIHSGYDSSLLNVDMFYDGTKYFSGYSNGLYKIYYYPYDIDLK